MSTSSAMIERFAASLGKASLGAACPGLARHAGHGMVRRRALPFAAARASY